MKKIAILGDTIVNGNIYGVQRFCYEILREIDKKKIDRQIEVIVPQYSEVNISFKRIKIVRYGKIKNAFLWRQLCFTQYIKKNDCISVDMTLGLPYLGCDIVCLHDCTYEIFKDEFTTLKSKLRRKSYLIRAKHLVKISKKIVTVSQYSKKQLINYYKINSNKIEVIYNSWQHYERINSNTSILDDLGLIPYKYYFSLGSGLKHKNILWIVNAAINNPDYKFVLTGSDTFSDYLNEIGIQNIGNLIYTGYLSDSDVKGLMSKAKAFVHPAVCEGFGIPPLEALASGTDIIISEASCLPEIYEDAAVYFDPYNYHINMGSFIDFPSQAQKDKVLDKYSWENSANMLLEICYKCD